MKFYLFTIVFIIPYSSSISAGNCFPFFQEKEKNYALLTPPRKQFITNLIQKTHTFHGDYEFDMIIKQISNNTTKIYLKTKDHNDGKITFEYNSNKIAYFVYLKTINNNSNTETITQLKKAILNQGLHTQCYDKFTLL